ncbi:HlyD family secretion protein [Ferrimonas gelatinilytica]|uniref:HlyD family efflux transporter periplasmic adaptor subunit n=1 Tax=Ferrimonas gelatinilytica TaxID=1255257 RepID=A0ABP9RY92_9GAMM
MKKLGFWFIRVWPVAVLILAGCGTGEGERLALGSLERDRITHSATINEVLVALPVAQGSWVEQGDLLAQLDDRQQQARVHKARADVAAAEANLDKLRNGARPEAVGQAQSEVVGAQAELREAERSFARIDNLVSRGLASTAELDHSRAQRDSTQAALRSAQERLLELTNGTREEDLRMGEAQLAAARAELAGQVQTLSELTITATRSGRLDNLPWNLGERVRIGSPVAVVLAGEAPYARVYVPEPYRASVRTGQSLSVRVDGVAQSWQGRVRWISNEPAFTPYYALNESERSRLMYLAEVQLPAEAAALPNGLPAQVVLP